MLGLAALFVALLGGFAVGHEDHATDVSLSLFIKFTLRCPQNKGLNETAKVELWADDFGRRAPVYFYDASDRRATQSCRIGVACNVSASIGDVPKHAATQFYLVISAAPCQTSAKKLCLDYQTRQISFVPKSSVLSYTADEKNLYLADGTTTATKNTLRDCSGFPSI